MYPSMPFVVPATFVVAFWTNVPVENWSDFEKSREASPLGAAHMRVDHAGRIRVAALRKESVRASSA